MTIIKKSLGRVDLTKPEVSLKFFMMLIVAGVMIMAAVAVAKYGYAKLTDITAGARGKVEEATATII